jgi:hypothetical protein
MRRHQQASSRPRPRAADSDTSSITSGESQAINRTVPSPARRNQAVLAEVHQSTEVLRQRAAAEPPTNEFNNDYGPGRSHDNSVYIPEVVDSASICSSASSAQGNRNWSLNFDEAFSSREFSSDNQSNNLPLQQPKPSTSTDRLPEV